LISPSEILSNRWLNWCRKCSVPIHEKITCFHLEYPRFHTNFKHVHSYPTPVVYTSFKVTRFTKKTVSHFNPCPRILNRATMLMTYLLREQSSNTPARQLVHVHQKPVSQAKQTNCDKPQIFLIKSKGLDHVRLSKLPDA